MAKPMPMMKGKPPKGKGGKKMTPKGRANC